MKKIDDLSQLKRLVMFYYVVELGSFAKAADKLGMNRSGVSEQIGMLEQYLNMRILHRTTRKLSLTSDGEAILPAAKAIAQNLDVVKNILSEDLVNGRIRITTTNDFAIRWLSKKIKTFQTNYTGISFDFMISEQKVNLVEQQIDLAVRLNDGIQSNAEISRPLLRERTQIFASPSYLDEFPKIKSVEKIHGFHWILLKQLDQSNEFTLYKNNSNASFPVKPSLFHRVNSPIVMIEQVKMGLGLGLILPSMVEKEVAKGELVPVLPVWSGDENIFSVVYSTQKQMPRRVKLFLDFLIS